MALRGVGEDFLWLCWVFVVWIVVFSGFLLVVLVVGLGVPGGQVVGILIFLHVGSSLRMLAEP